MPSPPREAPDAGGLITTDISSSSPPSPGLVPSPIICWRPRHKSRPLAEWLEEPEPQAIRIQALLHDVAVHLWHLPSDTAIKVTVLAQGT